ncbi:VOC family protein [Paenibacillus psychroresistens]|uniref:VOC family protein n=2 Tax=Paenibacillus psychroresistens TaxID=1778678 RepID=A0A6B8RYJ4_9BACL|nr:VOC family protein [Paenibacillus psychroresistens]
MQTPESDIQKTEIAVWLTVSSSELAAEYYMTAFRTQELYRLENDNGKLELAQLSVNGANFWISEDPEFTPEMASRGSIRMIMTVKDPDSVFDQAVAAGATIINPILEEYGWRIGRIVDPFGYHWEIGKKVDSM